jgi:hypothetical protein
MVVHTCIPNTLRVEAGRVWDYEFQASLGCMMSPCLRKDKLLEQNLYVPRP